MEHESHSHYSGHGKDGMLFPAVLLLSALMLSAAIYYGASNIANSTLELKTAVSGLQSLKLEIPTLAPSQGNPQPQVPQPTAPPAGPVDVKVGDRPFRGAADAKVTVVEFSDFQCPYCKRAFPTVEQVMKDYSGKVKLYYMHFPLSFHQNAQISAEAYECAADQGKGWEFHDKLFEVGQSDGTGLDKASLKTYAKGLGLDAAKFDSCLDGGNKTATVQADFSYGASLGVSGTPTFYVNGKQLVGAQPYESFKALIDAELAA